MIQSVQFKVGALEIGLEPEPGIADSGDLETDLPALFIAIAEAAEEKETQVAMLIDEIQYFSAQELSALIMAMHKMQQRSLPIVLVGAGLPVLPGLAGESKTYAERLFNFPHMGALTEQDANKALQDPVRAYDVSFSPEALEEIYRLTYGYPYFLQEWGYQAWNAAQESPIGINIIHTATQTVIDRLDEKTESLGPVRAKLIKKGMIYSPSYGFLDFTVPLFDKFMRRMSQTKISCCQTGCF